MWKSGRMEGWKNSRTAPRRFGTSPQSSSLPIFQSSNRRTAFTLIELLVTLSIAAGLMLVGVGVYYRMNRGFAVRGAVTHLESALRGARTFAVHNRSRVTVVLKASPADKDDRKADNIVESIAARGRQTVSCWHFEEAQFSGPEILGALGQKATITGGASLDEDGRIGDALKLDGSSQYLSVDDARLHGIRGGIFVEAYVRPDVAATGTLPIAAKGSAFSLALVYDGGLNRFSLKGTVECSDGDNTATTEATLVPDEWAHVALAYERDAPGVILKINGREMAFGGSSEGPVTMNTSPLLIGSDGSTHFHGSIDELQVATLVAEETRKLLRNANVTVLEGTVTETDTDGRLVAWRIHFDDEGKLAGIPVSIYVGSETDDLHRIITVGRLGNVEVQRVHGRPTQ